MANYEVTFMKMCYVCFRIFLQDLIARGYHMVRSVYGGKHAQRIQQCRNTAKELVDQVCAALPYNVNSSLSPPSRALSHPPRSLATPSALAHLSNVALTRNSLPQTRPNLQPPASNSSIDQESSSSSRSCHPSPWLDISAEAFVNFVLVGSAVPHRRALSVKWTLVQV